MADLADRNAERVVRSMSLGTARLLVTEIEAESTARIAELEAALGGVLAEFTAEAEHVEGSGWYVVWVPQKRLEAWRDTLAGGK